MSLEDDKITELALTEGVGYDSRSASSAEIAHVIVEQHEDGPNCDFLPIILATRRNGHQILGARCLKLTENRFEISAPVTRKRLISALSSVKGITLPEK